MWLWFGLLLLSSNTVVRGGKLSYCELHPAIEEQIKKDVSAWGTDGITEDVVQSMSKHCNSTKRLEENCAVQAQRITVDGGNVYLNNLIRSDRLGPHEHIGLLEELYEASQVYKLPDVEFTQWIDDHPPAETNLREDGSVAWPHAPHRLPPVVSWGKGQGNGVLLVPYSGAFRCPEDSFDALQSVLIDNKQGVPWKQKKEVAFGRWSGFCTHYYTNGLFKSADGNSVPCPRTYLNDLSDRNPDLVDARDLSRSHPVPLVHQPAYKYIVSTDGWSVSSKFDKYLLMGSTVFKAASPRFGFYYPALKPFVHYVPFMTNHSDDLVDAVKWARAHDADARRIAEEARAFALKHLTRPARLCYLFRLLTELSKQFKYQVSCRRRKLCVPLVEELKFLATYPSSSESCRYHEVLSKYAANDPSAWPGESVESYEKLRAMHEDPTHWPRDDLP